MKVNSIVTKLGLTILFIILAILFPLGFVSNKILANFYYQQVYEETDSLSSKYANTVTRLDSDFLHMFETLANLTNKHVVIINEEGMIVANSGLSSFKFDSSIEAVTYKTLQKGNSVEGEFVVQNQRYLGIGKPIFRNDRFMGAIIVLSSLGEMDASMNQLQKVLLFAGIGALLMAAGIIYIVSKKLSNPLLEMEIATRKIAQGNLDTKLTYKTKDEIGSLSYAINELAQEIKSSRDTKREFFANISHELKTPITYLEGYAKALREGLVKTEKEKNQYLEIIESEAKRLSTLVSDLFELSKIEEGKIHLNLEEVDLSEVLDNIVLRFNMKVRNKGIDIYLINGNRNPYIYGDGNRLEQIFFNLIENAVRYTDVGSIEISIFHDERNVIVSIKDTGMGIPQEEIPLLFERFYRVEKSRSRDFGGTGLGLAIVKNLIDLHHGTISVQSVLGKGTTFTVTFPIYEGRDKI